MPTFKDGFEKIAIKFSATPGGLKARESLWGNAASKASNAFESNTNRIFSKLKSLPPNRTAQPSKEKFQALKLRWAKPPKLEDLIPQSQNLKNKIQDLKHDQGIDKAVERIRSRMNAKAIA